MTGKEREGAFQGGDNLPQGVGFPGVYIIEGRLNICVFHYV